MKITEGIREIIDEKTYKIKDLYERKHSIKSIGEDIGVSEAHMQSIIRIMIHEELIKHRGSIKKDVKRDSYCYRKIEKESIESLKRRVIKLKTFKLTNSEILLDMASQKNDVRQILLSLQ